MKPSTWGPWLGRLFRKQIRTPKRGPRLRPGLEVLEDRLAPATFTWTGLGADANWGTKENWQGNVAPTGNAYHMALSLSTGQTSSYAIVGALALYLDFINLFLFLIRFTGNRRD